MTRKVIIMRGASGSGKSTYTKKHYGDAVVCSADNYYVDDQGNYNFDPTKIGAAHRQCKRSFKDALDRSEPLVVVDNTNTTLKELQPYIQVAEAHGYEVEVVRVETPLDIAAKRNAHGVPFDAVKRMKDRTVDYPGEKIVSGTD
jgi:NEDD4-binding protein 2